jgi:hypothetical protein
MVALVNESHRPMAVARDVCRAPPASGGDPTGHHSHRFRGRGGAALRGARRLAQSSPRGGRETAAAPSIHAAGSRPLQSVGTIQALWIPSWAGPYGTRSAAAVLRGPRGGDVPVVSRVLQQDSRIGRLVLPAGTQVAASIFLLHRRASLYSDPIPTQSDSSPIDSVHSNLPLGNAFHSEGGSADASARHSHCTK